eukprot:TRINITY_DN4443_c0_g1_i2.p1 TRINITY_DN4443_c0_g1~~TRINITY_DN4443_c0_g1_i2.p1  ORF type:complete len:219 (+),score=16.80 TRINITY_DN4443_c0_g1_i2:62-718(+)
MTGSMQVPCYAQVLLNAHRKLLNKERLRDVWSAQDFAGSYLLLFLVHLELPARLEVGEAHCAWEAFRMYSTDHGETISQLDLGGLLYFLPIAMPLRSARERLAGLEWISFADIVSMIATCKSTNRAKRPHLFLDECYPESNDHDSDTIDQSELERLVRNMRGGAFKSRIVRRMLASYEADFCSASDEVPIGNDWSASNIQPLRLEAKDSLVSPRLISL